GEIHAERQQHQRVVLLRRGAPARERSRRARQGIGQWDGGARATKSPVERGGRRRPARAHRRADRRGDRPALERARAGGTRLMSGGGLDELTTARKRGLLAGHRRKRSRLAPSPGATADDAAPPTPVDDSAAPRAPGDGRKSFLDDEVIELASLRD